MTGTDSNYDSTYPCEGSEELNGSDAAYRTAPLTSSPAVVVKRRIRGALVPLGSSYEAFSE